MPKVNPINITQLRQENKKLKSLLYEVAKAAVGAKWDNWLERRSDEWLKEVAKIEKMETHE